MLFFFFQKYFSLDYLEDFPVCVCIYNYILLRMLCHLLCELVLSLSSACELKISVKITIIKAFYISHVKRAIEH